MHEILTIESYDSSRNAEFKMKYEKIPDAEAPFILLINVLLENKSFHIIPSHLLLPVCSQETRVIKMLELLLEGVQKYALILEPHTEMNLFSS